MTTNTQDHIDETKKRILEMRKTLSTGVQEPHKAAQCACMALLTLVDLMDYIIADAEESQTG